MRTIRLNVNGREVEAILVEKATKRRKIKVVRDKVYTWEEYMINVYVPKRFADKKFAIIPLD